MNDFVLIPYVEMNGSRTLPDSFLEDAFDGMVERSLVSTVFHGTTMNNGDDFIGVFRNPANISVFVLNQDKQCIAFAWLNGIGANSAYGHFCFFKDLCADTQAVGQAILDYWFSLSGGDGPFLDVILGAVPAFNHRACAFVQKLGFVKLGEIPKVIVNKFTGEKWASVIHYMLRP